MQDQAVIDQFYDSSDNPCQKLLKEIRSCDACIKELPLGPRPVLNFHSESKIIIAGQAPGTKVHNSGLPWNDASGERLREWLSISNEDFYDVTRYSIIPMGYCYPGKGKSGDLPPRQECRDLWLDKILSQLPNVKLVIAIGQYAQSYYVKNPGNNLTETVKNWQAYIKSNDPYPVFPLPHPSPRNNIWLKKNPWFEKELIPELRKTVQKLSK